MLPILSLEQALAFNRARIKTNRQSTLQIKNWYAQGYYMTDTGQWCNSNGSLKYSNS